MVCSLSDDSSKPLPLPSHSRHASYGTTDLDAYPGGADARRLTAGGAAATSVGAAGQKISAVAAPAASKRGRAPRPAPSAAAPSTIVIDSEDEEMSRAIAASLCDDSPVALQHRASAGSRKRKAARAPSPCPVSLLDDDGDVFDYGNLIDDDDAVDYGDLVDNGDAASDGASESKGPGLAGDKVATGDGASLVAATTQSMPSLAHMSVVSPQAAGLKRRRSDPTSGSSSSGPAVMSPSSRGAAAAADSVALPPLSCVPIDTRCPRRVSFPPPPLPGSLDMPPEPPAMQQLGGSGACSRQCSRLQIRLPDGSRLVRRLDPQETVAALYAVAACALGRPHTLAGLYVRARGAAAVAAAAGVSASAAVTASSNSPGAHVSPESLIAEVRTIVMQKRQLGSAVGDSLAAPPDRSVPPNHASGDGPLSLEALSACLPENVSIAPLEPPPLQGGASAAALASGPVDSLGKATLPAPPPPRPLRLSLHVSAHTGAADASATAASGAEGGACDPSPSCFDHWDLGLPAPWVSLGPWAGATLQEAGLGASSTVVVRLLV